MRREIKMQNLKFFLPSSKDLIFFWPQLKELSIAWDFWSLDSMEESMQSTESVIFFVELDENLVGFSFWKRAFDEAELLYLYVREGFRGKAIGHQLLNYSYSHLASQGVRSIFLEVRPSNEGAIKLYVRNGFKEIARRKGYYSNGEDCLVMMKGLIK
jgi:ribosomal-protein-alanine N-acetyltransferase